MLVSVMYARRWWITYFGRSWMENESDPERDHTFLGTDKDVRDMVKAKVQNLNFVEVEEGCYYSCGGCQELVRYPHRCQY